MSRFFITLFSLLFALTVAFVFSSDRLYSVSLRTERTDTARSLSFIDAAIKLDPINAELYFQKAYLLKRESQRVKESESQSGEERSPVILRRAKPDEGSRDSSSPPLAAARDRSAPQNDSTRDTNNHQPTTNNYKLTTTNQQLLLKQCLHLYKRCVNLSPSWPQYHLYYALVLTKMGSNPVAREFAASEFRKAAELKPYSRMYQEMAGK